MATRNQKEGNKSDKKKSKVSKQFLDQIQELEEFDSENDRETAQNRYKENFTELNDIKVEDYDENSNDQRIHPNYLFITKDNSIKHHSKRFKRRKERKLR